MTIEIWSINHKDRNISLCLCGMMPLQNIINKEHLLYQHIDAFLTEHLSQPNPVSNWQQWPTLYSSVNHFQNLQQEKVTCFTLVVNAMA